MQTVPLPFHHAVPGSEMLARGLPRPLAEASAGLVASSGTGEASIAIVVENADRARRASELLLQLAATIPFTLELAPKVVRFHADGAHVIKVTRQENRPARFTAVHSAEQPVSAAEQQWFREWLQRNELEAGFAVVVPLETGVVAQRLIEEAKLVAAVYHGTYHVFGATELSEGGARRTQACCAW